MIYTIEEEREVIRGYVTETFEVEANSYEEALEKIKSGDPLVNNIDYDIDSLETEHIEYKLVTEN